MVTFWGAIKLYFQINMTKALILNVMPDMIVVKYVNFENIIFYYEISCHLDFRSMPIIFISIFVK